MSCNWGLHCKGCHSHTGIGINHGEQTLSDFVRMAPLIRQLYRMDSTWHLDISVLGGFWIDEEVSGGHTTLIGWLMQHCGHVMELYSEYGEYTPLWPELARERRVREEELSTIV